MSPALPTSLTDSLEGTLMFAAVVSDFAKPPVYGDFPEPRAGEGEVVINVRAAPLSPIVRSLAAGKHYASSTHTRFVPGIDGVGTDPDGRRVYFLFPRPPYGSMAQTALVASDSVVPVPDGVADERAAAVVTAGLSSWVALTLRAKFQRGESVLINGATGSAGGLAVQIAAHLGASRIIATGRSKAKLTLLPESVEKIALDDTADEVLRRAFSGKVDVVLDYLWGEPASRIIAQATAGRGSRSGEPRLRFVQMARLRAKPSASLQRACAVRVSRFWAAASAAFHRATWSPVPGNCSPPCRRVASTHQ